MSELAPELPLAPGVEEYASIRYGADYAQDVKARMERNYGLLEAVVVPEEGMEAAALTVCIPVALMQEESSTIDRLLDTIHRSQEAFGRPVEVMLWTNTRVEEADSTGREAATQRYAELKDSLQRFQGTSVHIKTALQLIPEKHKAISEIRSDYMEAAALDALKNGRDADYPIMWMDADNTYISQNAFTEVESKLRNHDALLVHATEKYTTEWAAGQPMNERDVATQAIMVYEINRRKNEKFYRGVGRRMQYAEESGLAFTIGTYLKMGGVNDKDPVNEVTHLIAYANGLYNEGFVDRKKHMNELMDDRMDGYNPKVFLDLPEVKVGISARQWYNAAQERGTEGILRPQQRTMAHGYRLHSDKNAPAERVSATISRQDVHDMVRQSSNQHFLSVYNADNLLDEAKVQQVAKLVDTHFAVDPQPVTQAPVRSKGE